MKMLISDTKQVRTLQKQFEAEFPHLRLEFFAKYHDRGESSPWDEKVDAQKTLGEFRRKHITGKIEIVPEMSVAREEALFREAFGLSVQVFRRSGNAWLETTPTDNWSLAKQEEQGKAMAGGV